MASRRHLLNSERRHTTTLAMAWVRELLAFLQELLLVRDYQLPPVFSLVGSPAMHRPPGPPHASLGRGGHDNRLN